MARLGDDLLWAQVAQPGLGHGASAAEGARKAASGLRGHAHGTAAAGGLFFVLHNARCTLHGGTRVAGPTSRIEAGMYTVSIGRRPVAVLHSVGGQRGCVGTCRVALLVATYVYRRLSAATVGTASQKAARSVSLTKT